MCRWCRDTAAGSLTDRRSQPVLALALSPIDGPRAPGDHQALRISFWTSTASSEQGSDLVAPRCINALSKNADVRMVAQ
jgi:hypothetical protein